MSKLITSKGLFAFSSPIERILVEHVKLIYDGPAFEGGTIDVYTLAPALMEFGDAIKETNRIIHGTESKIRVAVQSDFKNGSFEIEIALSILEHIRSMLDSDIVWGAGGVFALLTGYIRVRKWLKGEHPTQIEHNETNYNLTIYNSDGAKMEIAPQMEQMIKSEKVRKSVRAFVENPLKEDGIESVTLSSEKHNISETVEKEEGKYMSGPDPDEEVLLSTQKNVGLSVVQPNFESKKWKFRQGKSTRWAEIQDERFWQEVQKGKEGFHAGDILIVDIETRQTLSGKELKTEEAVVHVHEHRAGPQQQTIELEVKKDEEE